MALTRCGIVGVTHPNVIWGRNLQHGSGTGPGKHHQLQIWVGLAEMVDAHISKGVANKQLTPSR